MASPEGSPTGPSPPGSKQSVVPPSKEPSLVAFKDTSGDLISIAHSRDLSTHSNATSASVGSVLSFRRQSSKRRTRIVESINIEHEDTTYEITREPVVIVLHENIDVTPNRIQSNQHKNSGGKFDLEFEGGNLSERRSRVSQFSPVSRPPSEVQFIDDQDAPKRITAIVSLDDLKVDFVACNVGNQVDEDLDMKAPSAMWLPKMSSKMIFPSEIRLFLEETETIFLFELASVTVMKGSAEGDSVEKENESYDYLTIGKGRNRKTVTTEAQTLACIRKTRHTIAPRVEKANNSAFASVWDMFDSYGVQASDTLIKMQSEDTIVDPNRAREDAQLTKEEFKIKSILNSTVFFDAVMMMERIIANNNFKVEQEDFKGLVRSDDDICEASYEYELMFLWVFSYFKIENRTVTAMCINTGNSDIIAVGYGKFLYSEVISGIICIWSIKNPTQPERLWEFDTPLTSLAFSKTNPNLLAAGFYNGDVHIVDITSYNKHVIAKSSRNSSPTFQPVWYVTWYYAVDYNPDVEQVLAIGQDGRINRFTQTKTKDFVCKSIMRIIQTEGNVKSIYEEDWCLKNEIPIVRNTICHFYCPHPSLDSIYFVGTSDGYIYKCSKNYLNQHMSFFLAHDGPVYQMQFSHYCEKIFLTCGADWKVKIWRENVDAPLVILTTDMNPVTGAVFCPTHSTIIAAVSGTSVYIWNIQQKIDTATLVIELPTQVSKLSMVLFTENGKNLIISDVMGGVHMYALLGVCKPAEDQYEILDNTLHKILLIRPELLEKIVKAKKHTK